ncbi:MAG: DUF4276 family protein [Candidatus Coatesbacteria bacterium]|nr:DUF4276 family protein [Candidatus Coatesbacteria bacterium]
MADLIPVHLAVEDQLSEAVLHAILRQSGRNYHVGTCLGRRGFSYLKKRIGRFNNAAKGTPFIVLTDLDRAECAPALVKDWLKAPKHHNLIFRVAVKEVESWIIADRSALASFLGIKREVVPEMPDKLDDPKEALVGLARKSRKTDLRDAIVPTQGSKVKRGPDYNATVGRFVKNCWDAKAAMKASPSLRRTFEAISGFRPTLPKNGAINEGK